MTLFAKSTNSFVQTDQLDFSSEKRFSTPLDTGMLKVWRARAAVCRSMAGRLW